MDFGSHNIDGLWVDPTFIRTALETDIIEEKTSHTNYFNGSSNGVFAPMFGMMGTVMG